MATVIAQREKTIGTGAVPYPRPRQNWASIQSTPWQNASTWSSTPPRGEKELFHQGVSLAGKAHLAGLHQRGHGMGAGSLAALGRDGDQSRHLAPEQLADRRAVGGVFDQHGVGAQALALQGGE